MADPPWEYDQGCWQRSSSAAQDKYSTLTVEEIAALPVRNVAGGEAVVWLWVPSWHLIRGLHLPVLEAWGARPMNIVTWRKMNKKGTRQRLGLGRYARNTTEHVLLCVRGAPKIEETLPTCFDAPRRGHSEKPPEFYEQYAERAYPGPRLELFGRGPRAGWTVWGNEVGDPLGWGFDPEGWAA